MKESKKTKVWIYTVILFTSAFIVLLFTAYSQIKMNKNLSQYKSQVYNKDTEISKYQQNFLSAQEMNTKLNEEIKSLQEENDSLRSALNDANEEKENLKKTLEKKKEATEALSNAFSVYLAGNAAECVELLKNVDKDSLDAKTLLALIQLTDKAKAEAGKALFEEGFALYNKGEFKDASEKLLLSFQYAPAEDFSDKCLYYLAYSEFKAKDTQNALEYMNKLIKDYPSSQYIKSAKRFVEKYG